MTALLEDRGIKVLVIPLPEGVSGLTCLVRRPRRKDKVPVIVVNRNVTLARRRFTLAHELAHRLIDDDSPVEHEKASNIFAGAFLAPKDHLIREIGKHRNALGYKERLRLMQVGVIDDSTMSYAFQSFARAWRSEEPDPLEGAGEEGKHELPRRFERLCYWALAERLISPGKAGELLQQPLSEIERGLKGPADADHRQ